MHFRTLPYTVQLIIFLACSTAIVSALLITVMCCTLQLHSPNTTMLMYNHFNCIELKRRRENKASSEGSSRISLMILKDLEKIMMEMRKGKCNSK